MERGRNRQVLNTLSYQLRFLHRRGFRNAYDLEGKVVGTVGAGRIGQRVRVQLLA